MGPQRRKQAYLLLIQKRLRKCIQPPLTHLPCPPSLRWVPGRTWIQEEYWRRSRLPWTPGSSGVQQLRAQALESYVHSSPWPLRSWVTLGQSHQLSLGLGFLTCKMGM